MAEVKAGTLNEVLSFFNPEMKKVINYLLKFIPKKSFLKSGAVVRALGVLASFIETKAGKIKNPFLSAFVEKSSDFVEILADELGEKHGKSTKKGGVSEAAERIKDAFVAKIMQRIQKSKDPEEEVKKIKKEFELFDKLMSELEKPEKDQDQDEEEVNKSLSEIWEESSFRRTLKRAGRKITKAFRGIVRFFDRTVIPGLEELWDTANEILRVVIIGLLLAPLGIALVAVVGVPWVVSLITLALLVLAVLALIGTIKPILFGIAWLIPSIRTALRKVAAILGIELFIGVYFSFMSYFLKTSSIPTVLLLIFTIFFLSIARQGGFVKIARALVVLLLLLVSFGSIASCLFPRMFSQFSEKLAIFGIFSEKTGSEEDIASQGEWLQEKWDDETDSKLEGIQSSYEKGKISLDSALVLTKLVQKRSESFRRGISEDPSVTTPSLSTPSSASTSVSGSKKKVDVFTTDITPPVKGWSEEVNLFTLKPFRSKYGFRVTDSVHVLFRNGRDIVVGPADSLKNLGNGPAIFRVQALRASTLVVAEAYNLQ